MAVTAYDRHDDGVFAWDLTVRAQDVELWRKEVAAAVAALAGGPGRPGGSGEGGASAGSAVLALARLGVSELLANAVKHVADPACRLEVRRVGAMVYVRLFDRSRRVPAVLVPDVEAESGRGLWLLREMADGLGYTLTTGGKWVWFRIRVAAAREAVT